MEKKFQVHVFGKAGCDKCAVLNKRLEQMLQEDELQAFEKVYHDVETVEGLIAFSRTECMNPSRIPGFVISRKQEQSEPLSFMPRLFSQNSGEKSLLYSVHGVQTDYSETGRGVIAPALIKKVLSRALENEY
jgi:hypothetical protein